MLSEGIERNVSGMIRQAGNRQQLEAAGLDRAEGDQVDNIIQPPIHLYTYCYLYLSHIASTQHQPTFESMSLSAISRKTASLRLSNDRQHQIHIDPTPAKIQPLPLSSSHLPIPTFTLTRTLAGVQTDLLIQSYEDRVFVMITQLGRMGFLVSLSTFYSSSGMRGIYLPFPYFSSSITLSFTSMCQLNRPKRPSPRSYLS